MTSNSTVTFATFGQVCYEKQRTAQILMLVAATGTLLLWVYLKGVKWWNETYFPNYNIRHWWGWSALR